MFALKRETEHPLRRGDGPVGMIISPSRELARQTYEVVEHFSEYLAKEVYCMCGMSCDMSCCVMKCDII